MGKRRNPSGSLQVCMCCPLIKPRATARELDLIFTETDRRRTLYVVINHVNDE